jgi:hypothetical protein
LAYCTNCGKVIGTEEVFCSRCGGRVWDGQFPRPATIQYPSWQPIPNKKNEELWVILVIAILFIAVNIAVPYVLYMMVMGFGEELEDTPIAILSVSDSGLPHQEKVLIADISSPISYEDLSLTLIINGSVNFMEIHPGVVFTGSGQDTGYSVEYVDLDADYRVGAGDYFLVNNPAGEGMLNVEIYLSLLFGDQKAAIAMVNWSCT